MYERLLVPTDGAAAIEPAVDHALNLAEVSGGTLHALHVVDTRDYSSLPEAELLSLQSEFEHHGERALAAVADRAEARGVPVETAIDRGVPHETIVEYADRHEMDVVVMGTHCRRGLQRVLVGSVTEKVLRTSPVPVLAVDIAD